MTFKIVVLSLVLGIWGLDARSQNEEPDFSGQSEDSLMQALGNIPAFTIYKDNYVVTGTSFTGGKFRNTIRMLNFRLAYATGFTASYYLIGFIYS